MKHPDDIDTRGLDPDDLSPERMSELAALADGSLTGPPAARLTEELRVAPREQALLDEQRRAVSLMQDVVGSVRAPDALRERLAWLDVADAEPQAERRTRRAPRWRIGGVAMPRIAGVTAGLAALAVLLVVAFSGAGGAPSVAQAAALAVKGPTLPAPRERDHSDVLGAKQAGVPFPYWDDRFGLDSVGARVDQIAGRTVATVYYGHGDRQIAYSIVSGSSLRWPSSGRVLKHNGVILENLSYGGRSVVIWERAGHTCVLSATGVPASTLIGLASWRGDGTITF